MLKFLVKLLSWGGGWGGGHKSHTEIVIVGRGGWGEATNPMLKYPVKLLSGGDPFHHILKMFYSLKKKSKKSTSCHF